jgi:hypothetical protein
VIYVEPHETVTRRLTTNTARTALLLGNEALPWSDWAAEFRDKIPGQIAALVAEKAEAAAHTDHTKPIRDRLKEIIELFKISRYRPTAEGTVLIDDERLARGGRSSDQAKTARGGTESRGAGGSGGTGGNVYAVFEKSNGVAGKRTKLDLFTIVPWVTMRDGTREYGDIEDRAAKFLADQNLLLVNADFRVFSDMIAFFAREFAQVPGIADLARDAVRGWFEQALVETVIGVQGLINSKEWTQTDIDSALSDEGLTAGVMQR